MIAFLLFHCCFWGTGILSFNNIHFIFYPIFSLIFMCCLRNTYSQSHDGNFLCWFLDLFFYLSHLNLGVLSHVSCVWLFAILWTIAHQAPLPMWFSRRVYLSGLPCHSPEDLPDPGIKPTSQIKNFCILCKPVSLI